MSEPVEVLLKRLAAIESGREAAKGFHFFCQIGSADWSGGVTTLQVSGTGWTIVGHRARATKKGEEPEDELYSVYLSAEDTRAFARVLLQNPFWELDHSRWDREDGETNLHFRLADTSQSFAWGIQLWSNEVQRQKKLASLMRVVNIVIDRVSEGHLKGI